MVLVAQALLPVRFHAAFTADAQPALCGDRISERQRLGSFRRMLSSTATLYPEAREALFNPSYRRSS
jgi:hypothetical protein